MPANTPENIRKIGMPDPTALAELKQKLALREGMPFRTEFGFETDSVTDEVERDFIRHYAHDISSGQMVLARIEKGFLFGAKHAELFNDVMRRLRPYKKRELRIPASLDSIVRPHLTPGRHFDTPRTQEVRGLLGMDPKRYNPDDMPDYLKAKLQPSRYQSPDVPEGARLTAGMSEGSMALKSGDRAWWSKKHPGKDRKKEDENEE